jgi:hypothetical protein
VDKSERATVDISDVHIGYTCINGVVVTWVVAMSKFLASPALFEPGVRFPLNAIEL